MAILKFSKITKIIKLIKWINFPSPWLLRLSHFSHQLVTGWSSLAADWLRFFTRNEDLYLSMPYHVINVDMLILITSPVCLSEQCLLCFKLNWCQNGLTREGVGKHIDYYFILLVGNSTYMQLCIMIMFVLSAKLNSFRENKNWLIIQHKRQSEIIQNYTVILGSYFGRKFISSGKTKA